MRQQPILMVGSPRDPTFTHTVSALHQQRRDVEVLDLDRFCQSGVIEGRLDDPTSLVVRDAELVVPLSRFRSCYARLIELSPDVAADVDSPAWGRYRLLFLAISSLDVMVVNQPGAGDSNASKPYQISLLQRYGFQVPRSLSTNSAEAAAKFVASCSRGAIYKSNSGERSIVQAVTIADRDRFSLLTVCPVYFQERVWGDNLRIHVVRDQCHGVLIRSTAVDYRYDRSGTAVERPFAVPVDLAEKCIGVTQALGLEFSGIDLIVSDDDGTFLCLEVNPMPGYHGYDLSLNYVISKSLGALLATGARNMTRKLTGLRAIH